MWSGQFVDGKTRSSSGRSRRVLGYLGRFEQRLRGAEIEKPEGTSSMGHTRASAGFDHVDVLGEYTHEPATADNNIVVFAARK